MSAFSKELQELIDKNKGATEELRRLKQELQAIKEAYDRGEQLSPEQEEKVRRARKLIEQTSGSALVFAGKVVVSAAVGIGGALYGLATWDSKKFDRAGKWVKDKLWSKKQ